MDKEGEKKIKMNKYSKKKILNDFNNIHKKQNFNMYYLYLFDVFCDIKRKIYLQ